MRVRDACRRPAALSLVFLVVALFTLDGSAAAQTGASDTEAEVRAAESRRFAAMVRSDVGELERLLAEDVTYVHSSGQAQSREELLADLASGALRYRSIEPTISRVRVYGDVSVVNGRASVRVETDGRPMEAMLVYTDVYVRRDGRWLLAAWQSTRVPPPAPPAPPDPPVPPAPPAPPLGEAPGLAPGTVSGYDGAAGREG